MTGFRKAERRKAKLRLAIAGPSGSGKTLSSLLIAYGLTGDWGKIGLVDTENGSGDLYANSNVGGHQVGEYLILTLAPPYTPEKYIQAIKMAEEAGLEALIIDSASHAWAGEGGLLDQHGKIADRGGNSFAAWRQVTPKHNQFVEAMLRSNLHLIVTLRSKTEYVQQVVENGKTVVKKLGLAPIQRDGFEYEFTVFLDLAADHTAAASKDRTGLLDGQFFKPAPEIGKQLLAWLESGVDAPAPSFTPQATASIDVSKLAPKKDKEEVVARLRLLGITGDDARAFCQAVTGKDGSKGWTVDDVAALFDAIRAEEELMAAAPAQTTFEEAANE